jgi:murein L,D-transpeptidase YafK
LKGSQNPHAVAKYATSVRHPYGSFSIRTQKTSLHQRSIWRGAAVYNPDMRIRVLTAWLLCGMVTAQTAPNALHADRVVVLKKERTLELLSAGKVIKSYKIALGGDPLGPKTRQGDHKTPEGVYVLDSRNSHSQFHRAIHISYPNARDRASAQAKGVSPGGDVFVHGLPNGYGWVGGSHRMKDWTDGCIAVTNEEIEEIWKAVDDGTPIEIRP